MSELPSQDHAQGLEGMGRRAAESREQAACGTEPSQGHIAKH